MAGATDDRPLPDAANLASTATTLRHRKRFRRVRRWYRRTPTSQLVATLVMAAIALVAVLVGVVVLVVG